MKQTIQNILIAIIAYKLALEILDLRANKEVTKAELNSLDTRGSKTSK